MFYPKRQRREIFVVINFWEDPKVQRTVIFLLALILLKPLHNCGFFRSTYFSSFFKDLNKGSHLKNYTGTARRSGSRMFPRSNIDRCFSPNDLIAYEKKSPERMSML